MRCMSMRAQRGASPTAPRASSTAQRSGAWSRSVSHAIDHSPWLRLLPGLPRFRQGFPADRPVHAEGVRHVDAHAVEARIERDPLVLELDLEEVLLRKAVTDTRVVERAMVRSPFGHRPREPRHHVREAGAVGGDDEEPGIDASRHVVARLDFEDRRRDGRAVPHAVHVTDVRILARRVHALDDGGGRRHREEMMEAAQREEIRIDERDLRIWHEGGVEDVQVRVDVAVRVGEEIVRVARGMPRMRGTTSTRSLAQVARAQHGRDRPTGPRKSRRAPGWHRRKAGRRASTDRRALPQPARSRASAGSRCVGRSRSSRWSRRLATVQPGRLRRARR